MILLKRTLGSLLLLAGLIGSAPNTLGQGCVAVRCSAVHLGGHDDHYGYLDKGEWQAQLAHRWFRSDRHYIGDDEQEHRQAEGSQVVNNVHTFDLTGTYAFNKRFTLGLTLPFMTAHRSSLYEHDRTNRHTMTSGGLGDMRLVGNFWILNPEEHTTGNVGFGLGVEMPTGDYQDADVKHRATGAVLDYVDNSIQPGDGGWGIILEMAAFQKIWDRTFAYANATYLLTPEGQNSIGNSIWDSYVVRAGVQYSIWPSQGLALSLGGRAEGVPAHDWIGDTEGRRRPGYIISIEPGVTWTHQRVSVNVTAPVALYRNRLDYLGRPGDSAFADFAILSSVTYRF